MDYFWIHLILASTIVSLNFVNGQTVTLRQCYKCSGSRCISQQGFEVTDCATATDPCVTIYEEYTPIKRACYSALNTTEKAACDNTNNVACSKCETDICNDLGRIDHVCIECSSIKDRTCLTAPTTHVGTRCLAPLYNGIPSCYIKSDGETTQRGCIITASELQECATNSTQCSLCATRACNSYVFPAGRRKCYRGSAVDYCDQADDNCFAYNIYGEKKMCSMEVDNSVREFCENNPYRCMECLDDECNNNVKFQIQCRKCDGSSPDRNCVSNTNSLVNCIDGCATYIVNGTNGLGTTHRTCYENLTSALKTTCQAGTGVCELCLDDDCNSNIFPSNRLLCYQCESDGCEDANLQSTVCDLYTSTDKCVSIIKNGEATEFTCLSSLNRTKSCANTNTCTVSECTGNGCNNPSLFEKSTSCVQCDTDNDLQCTTAPDLIGSMPCKNGVDQCYTMLQGTKVVRGCFSDLTAPQQASCSENCDLCNSRGGCNDQIYPSNRLFCHQCDSRVNNGCDQQIIGAAPTMCVDYYKENKCIALLTQSGTYIRTCASDQTVACKDAVTCSACDTYGCNNAKISQSETTTEGNNDNDDGGSSSLSVNTIMVVALFTFMLIFK